jgi:hypothetical protein
MCCTCGSLTFSAGIKTFGTCTCGNHMWTSSALSSALQRGWHLSTRMPRRVLKCCFGAPQESVTAAFSPGSTGTHPNLLSVLLLMLVLMLLCFCSCAVASAT